jgi:hypothetical protein
VWLDKTDAKEIVAERAAKQNKELELKKCVEPQR